MDTLWIPLNEWKYYIEMIISQWQLTKKEKEEKREQVLGMTEWEGPELITTLPLLCYALKAYAF